MNHVSRRRDPEAVVGFVNFPTDRVEHTAEGGVFVRLVVIDPDAIVGGDYWRRWVPCTGGYHHIHLDECFLGDDRESLLFNEHERYFGGGHTDALSVAFIATLTIGATGWSSGEWWCGFDDLTADGAALVDSLKKLYPNCEIRLLTFLDT